MPPLQRMQDDPAFLESRERRFEQDEPPPYSSRSTTRELTHNPFPQTQADIDRDELLRKPVSDYEINVIRGRLHRYFPSDRYHDEVWREKERISEESLRRDENYNSLYRGPSLIGRPGQERYYIMARHSIKKRWQQLGVWNPKWGVPTAYLGRFSDDDGPRSWAWDPKPRGIKRKYDCLSHGEKMASWPSRDEETPDERAIRLWLERDGRWSETLKLQSSGAGNIYETDVLEDCESLITSRPWFVWALEVAEEEVRLQRLKLPGRIDTRELAFANVRAKWKEEGYWKDSWSNNMPRLWMGEWRDLPGWKWRHESPSPEPPDSNDMEFTPSEIDALEAIPPPTPPSPPPAWTLKRRSPKWSKTFGYLPGYDPDSAPPASAQSTLKPWANGDSDQEERSPGATSEPHSGQPAARSSDNDASAPVAPSRATSRKQRQRASRAPTSKVATSAPPPRRSPRIAERERR